jgi:hypothetical protein
VPVQFHTHCAGPIKATQKRPPHTTAHAVVVGGGVQVDLLASSDGNGQYCPSEHGGGLIDKCAGHCGIRAEAAVRKIVPVQFHINGKILGLLWDSHLTVCQIVRACPVSRVQLPHITAERKIMSARFRLPLSVFQILRAVGYSYRSKNLPIRDRLRYVY